MPALRSSDGDSHPKAKYHRLYNIWGGMKNRCHGKPGKDYGNYGAKGISVINTWRESYKAFKEWSLDNEYDDSKTIDRINTYGNYEPNNCRWTTAKVQQNNKTTNVSLFYKGKKVTLAQLAEQIGIKKSTIKSRKREKGLIIEELVKEVPKSKIITLSDGTVISRKEGASILNIPYRTMLSRYAKYGDRYNKLGFN